MRFCGGNRIGPMPFGLLRVCGGVLPTDDVVLPDMSSMSRTREIDDHDLAATFDAGKNGLEAEEEVAQRGFTIGHWPQSIAVSSVGGWVSTRARVSSRPPTATSRTSCALGSRLLPDGELVHPKASRPPPTSDTMGGHDGEWSPA